MMCSEEMQVFLKFPSGAEDGELDFRKRCLSTGMEVIMSEVYIFLADGFEEIEGLTVVDLLRRAGIDITMVSITGSKEITGAHNIKVIADELFDETGYNNAKMLVLPGGMPGTTHLLEHKKLRELLLRHNSDNKMIAAICAAPSVLGMHGILKGKKATCYPGFEDKLIGAIYTNEKVVEDKNVITSKGLGTAIDFAASIIEQYQGKEAAERIKSSIQYEY